MNVQRKTTTVAILLLVLITMVGCTTTVPLFINEKNGGLRPEDYTELGSVTAELAYQIGFGIPNLREALLEEANELYSGVDDVIGLGVSYQVDNLSGLIGRIFIEGVAVRYNN